MHNLEAEYNNKEKLELVEVEGFLNEDEIQ
jgi:hypothetical protein